MNVQDKIKNMESARGKNHDLLEFRQWLNEYLPQHTRLNKIQVAGTNGKGSTCKWMSLLLNKAGFTTGMFTSPHLVSHTERIQVNQENISLEDWERIYDTWYPLFQDKNMTMFEMDLWMALVYFIERGVNVAIIEVGMGGRLDATTALDYRATIITNIGLDHQEFLGDSLEQITFEKCGIFKPSSIALTTESKPNCQKVMEQVAEYMQVMLGFVTMPVYTKEEDGYHFEYNGESFIADIPEYQLNNMILALETLFVLGYPIEYDHIQSVLHDFVWQGRLSVLRQSPLLIVDGAHNVPGIQALVSSVSGFQGHIYFSVLKEKDAKEMLEILKTLDCPITLVRFDSYRLYPLETLGLPIIEFNELESIIKTTQENLLLCGSLYFVGDIYKMLEIHV